MRIWGVTHFPPERLFSLLLTLLLWSATCSGVTSAKKADPRISKTSFENRLHGLFYFKDSEIILAYDRDRGVLHRSTDAGEQWEAVEEIPEGKVADLWQHPYDGNKAYVLSSGHHHWYTNDQGITWKEFETAASPTRRSPLSFHAKDSNKIIFHGDACQSFFECDEVALYTTDGFSTEPGILRTGVVGCKFACSSDLFSTGYDLADADRILCIVKGTYSPWPKDYRLVISDNYFLDETEPELTPGRTVRGLVNMATVKKFLVVAAKAQGTDEMALYVTDDTTVWHRAEFPSDHKVEEDAYTILESTNYSIQVDVMNTKPSVGMGVLFTSNSNGTYFTRNVEHTNRDRHGLVDFEKLQGVQGIVMVNVVDNWEEVLGSSSRSKNVQSRISFDDGRTFQSLKAGKEDLQLHSVSGLHNSGRVFSSPAPGIIMGVGNTGDRLKQYEECDLYVSDDAGLNWQKARDNAHMYEFGDQGSILVAVNDETSTSQIAYSINHGHDWDVMDLGEEIRPTLLITTPDSTSLKFVLIGVKHGDSGREYLVFSIDFDGLHERKCKKADFEKWWARVDENGKPGCLMGHKQYYTRRKAAADCFIDEEFKAPQAEFQVCTCTDEDFECDYNFIRDGDTCVAVGPLLVPDGECKNLEGTFMGSSGYRLIPGNACRKDGGFEKDKPVERKCQDSVKPPASGKVTHEITDFSANKLREYYYLERTETSSGDDETIIMRTEQREIYITHDHGKTWEEILKGKEIVAISPHQYFNDVVFFITDSETVFYTTDRGKRIHQFEAPLPPNVHGLPILGFHPNKKDWLIWTGAKDCRRSKVDCHSVAYVTTDRGDQWTTLLRYVKKCQFITEEGRGRSEKLIYCEQYEGERLGSPLQLVASDDFYEEQTVQFNDIIDFATMSEFIIVAAKSEDRLSLKIDASVDGKTFADARFPPNFNVLHQQAYTVLNSSTHSVFLHVTVHDTKDHEYGSLLKSNSNGTSYVLSLSGVNRNTEGYADFERLQGLEGVIMVNVVENIEEVKGGEEKRLKTLITHNDGAEWSLLAPPTPDTDGNGFECKGSRDKCSLHLHGYTERENPGNTYTSRSAIGLTMGTGNVGEYLGPKAEADTFLSRDGGITWKVVSKGQYMWAYGDQGAIIVIVLESELTDTVQYSLDEGRTWKDYRFSDKKMYISELSTAPSANSRQFLLWGKVDGVRDKVSVVDLDFSGLTDRLCNLDEQNPEAGDYYLWQPKHPAQKDDCLFGHVAQYHRKRPDADCYNGPQTQHLHSIARNCSCTRQDFECDYNYERQTDGACGLVPGLSPADHSQICKEVPETIEWYEPSGYRRIPLTTCTGGRELEFIEAKARPCPQHEEEFKKTHGGRLSGIGLLLVIILPVLAATGAGYWVYRNWDGKFGRIRLGEVGSGSSSMIWDAGRPWIKYPVMAVAVVAAVLIALPDTARRVWRRVRSRFGRGSAAGGGSSGARTYTTRSSFARGRGDYDVVTDTDEGELLGEDSDEEV